MSKNLERVKAEDLPGGVTLADAEFLYALGKRRQAMLDQIRVALQINDVPEVVRLAKLLCGIEQEKHIG